MRKIISQVDPLLARLFSYRWVLVVIGGGLLFTFYLLISRVVVYNSDDASIVLEAQSVLQGNVLLQGWYVPTDNFITIDVPLYALGLLLGFSMSSLLHIIPAFLYTAVVMVGGYLVTLLLREKDRVWGVLAFLALAAFPPLYMVQRLLVGPIHIGTICLLFLGFMVYKHLLTGKSGRKTAFALLLLVIILATVGDPFALVLFVFPLLLTESIPLLLKKRKSWRENWMALSILLAIALSFAIRGILELVGVHNLVTAGFILTDIPGMLGNFTSALVFLYTIFHANIFEKGAFLFSNVPLFINAFAVSALVYAVIRWSWRSLLRPTTEIAKVISVFVWGFIGLLSAFTLSTLGGSTGMRYLYPLLFLGGVIGFAVFLPLRKKHLLIVGTLLVFAMNATLFVISLYQTPIPTATGTQLLTFLKEHHLTHGLGTYWVAPLVTVQSEGQVVIRQIVTDNRQIHPDGFLADERWFTESSLRNTNFLVYRDKDDPQTCYDASIRSFGTPDHHYAVDIYTILVWDTPLLTHTQPGYVFNDG